MCDEQGGQMCGQMYRDVMLPVGMSPQCLDDLSTLFNDFSDDLVKIGSEHAAVTDVAVMAFQLVQQHTERQACKSL